MWTVIYRMGGTDNATWHRQGDHRSFDEALQFALEIKKGGRLALIHKTKVLDVIGMPEGYDPVAWRRAAYVGDLTTLEAEANQ